MVTELLNVGADYPLSDVRNLCPRGWDHVIGTSPDLGDRLDEKRIVAIDEVRGPLWRLSTCSGIAVRSKCDN
jgi:hypothetical protein